MLWRADYSYPEEESKINNNTKMRVDELLEIIKGVKFTLGISPQLTTTMAHIGLSKGDQSLSIIQSWTVTTVLFVGRLSDPDKKPLPVTRASYGNTVSASQNAFYKKGEVYSFIRQLMSLHFLPPEHIPRAFRSLRQQAGTNQLQRLMDYIDRQWISSRTFPVESWSTYQVSIRTNNDVEGWHNRLNERCNTRGPVPFYLLLDELFREAEDIPLQLRMVTEGKLRRYQRKNSQLAQARVFRLWTSYEKGEMSTSQLLRRASKLLD